MENFEYEILKEEEKLHNKLVENYNNKGH